MVVRSHPCSYELLSAAFHSLFRRISTEGIDGLQRRRYRSPMPATPSMKFEVSPQRVPYGHGARLEA